MPKVILLVPVYNSGFIFNFWEEAIYNLNPKPDLVIFAENNSCDDTLQRIRAFKLPHEIIRVWFREDIGTVITNEKDAYLTIAHIRQLLLTRTRQINPDYAIFVDDDVLVPKNLISEVIDGNKDILAGYYYRRFNEGMWLSTHFYPSPSYANKEEKPKTMFADEMWVRFKCILETPQYVEGKYIECALTSCGCMALSRKIINDKRFGFCPRGSGNCGKFILNNNTSEDFGYCIKARFFGYKIYIHRSMRCIHILDLKRWKPWSVDAQNNYIKFHWEDYLASHN